MLREVNDKMSILIEGYRDIAKYLEDAKSKGEDAQIAAIEEATTVSVCCNACQAISSICVPDSSPSKCQGGCTITSFAF